MPRLNELQYRYGSHGLQIVSVNSINSTVEIEGFRTGHGARYGLAQVADNSGYTVPIFSTVFAIDRNGKVLWSGLNTDVTDAMVEQWLAAPAAGSTKDSEDGESCTTNNAASAAWLALTACILATWLRRSMRFG